MRKKNNIIQLPKPITRLEQWCANPQLASRAFEFFNSPEGRLLTQIMQEGEHVRLFATTGISADQKLGRIEGWDLYNAMLKRACEYEPPPSSQEVPATFAPPETEEQLEEEKE